MHLSYASPPPPPPPYPGTTGNRSHTHSLEANKSPATIHRLPCRARHLRHRNTDKSRPPFHGRTCQIRVVHLRSQPEWSPSSHRHNPIHVPRRQGRQHAPLLPGYLGARDTNDRCIYRTVAVTLVSKLTTKLTSNYRVTEYFSLKAYYKLPCYGGKERCSPGGRLLSTNDPMGMCCQHG